jgi:DNA-binding NtrC family response regulator
MTADTIICVCDQTCSKAVLTAITAVGYDVVSANSSNLAMALLFVMHSAAAVVLDLRATEQTSIDFARKLQAIHPGVPIVLRCCEHIESLPSWVDAYVSAGEPLEKLTSILRRMLKDEPAVDDCRLSDSLAHAA